MQNPRHGQGDGERLIISLPATQFRKEIERGDLAGAAFERISIS